MISDYENICVIDSFKNNVRTKKIQICSKYLTKKNILSEENTKKLFSNTDNLIFIKGKVEDTLMEKNNLPKKISILRLDTDFYESTKIELNIFYPLLSQRGVLIIDDYGDFPGCRKAVDEYFSDKNVLMIGIDKSCRVIIKD